MDIITVEMHVDKEADLKEGDRVIDVMGNIGNYTHDEDNQTHDIISSDIIIPYMTTDYIYKIISSTIVK